MCFHVHTCFRVICFYLVKAKMSENHAFIKAIISFHCIYALDLSRLASFCPDVVYLLYSQYVLVFLRHRQSESCTTAVPTNLQYEQRVLCFLARPVMIVIEFMSNGSLDSFLQVCQVIY